MARVKIMKPEGAALLAAFLASDATAKGSSQIL